MNLLSFVMGLLLIFACTFGLSLQKSLISQRVEKTFESHTVASRKILNTYESLYYRRLRAEPSKTQSPPKPKNPLTSSRPAKKKVLPNQECARLNLWPLITEDKENQRELYDAAAKLIRSLYAGHLFDNPKMEYLLLDSLIASAGQSLQESPAPFVRLEKLTIGKSNVKPLYNLADIYYRMLRGTKKTSAEQSFPSLLDVFVLDQKNSQICLYHASIQILNALFGERIACSLIQERSNKENVLTADRVRDICSQNGLIGVSDSFLKLFRFSSKHPPSNRHTLIEEDSEVCLKTNLFFPS